MDKYLNSHSKSLSLPIKINLASCHCEESLGERRIVSPKRNISKHVNHMRYNKNLASCYSDIINRKYLNKKIPGNYFNTHS